MRIWGLAAIAAAMLTTPALAQNHYGAAYGGGYHGYSQSYSGYSSLGVGGAGGYAAYGGSAYPGYGYGAYSCGGYGCDAAYRLPVQGGGYGVGYDCRRSQTYCGSSYGYDRGGRYGYSVRRATRYDGYRDEYGYNDDRPPSARGGYGHESSRRWRRDCDCYTILDDR